MNGSKLVQLITQNKLMQCEFNIHSSKNGNIWIDAIDKNGKRKLHLNTNTGEYKLYGNLNEGNTYLVDRFEGC